MNATRGLIIFAHGSRDARWREPVEAVAARAAALDSGLLVRCAYLEIVAPDLPSAAAELIALGAVSIGVLPLFLGIGKHLREDLPHLVGEVRTAHPEVRIELRPAIGEEPEVIELLARLALKQGTAARRP